MTKKLLTGYLVVIIHVGNENVNQCENILQSYIESDLNRIGYKYRGSGLSPNNIFYTSYGGDSTNLWRAKELCAGIIEQLNADDVLTYHVEYDAHIVSKK